MKGKVIGIILIFCLIFITNCLSFAGMEDILIPEATIYVKGRLSDIAVINSKAILNDPDLNAYLIEGYAVWGKPLNNFLENLYNPNSGSLELVFAIKSDGRFFFGCNGTLTDSLNVLGTLYSGEISTFPNNWEEDDGKFEPRDVALVGMGWRELKVLQEKGYISGLPEKISIFKDSCSIKIKYSPKNQYSDKKIFILYYPIFVVRGSDEIKFPEIGHTTDWGEDFLLNARWCQFSSVFDNGTAMRACELEYEGEVASYVYCAAANNSNEESWILLDGNEILRQINNGSKYKGIYNIYPQRIELGAEKTWSYVAPSTTITIIADSVSINNLNEAPNLGCRTNPPPDILVLEPDTWYGDFLYSPDKPKAERVITFDAYSNILDQDNEVLRYIWHFGDGNSSAGVRANHTYQGSGNYTVVLDRIDINGKVTSYQETISVYKSNCSSIIQIMKDTKLIESVKTYSKVDLSAICSDPEYYATVKNDFAVWEKDLNRINNTFPNVLLLFAINENGDFYLGAMGDDADVLSVLTDGGITTPSAWGYPIPEERELTDPWIKLDDKANMLAGLLGGYILKFKEKGYMKGGPEMAYSIYGPDPFEIEQGKIILDLDRLNFRLINRFDKPITILFTGIYNYHADSEYCCGRLFDTPFYSEVPSWPIQTARHYHWNPRPSDTTSAKSYRKLTLDYEWAEASFVSARVGVDNGNEGYVKFEEEEFIYYKDFPGVYKREANIYPNIIELYLKSHWSINNVYFRMAILGGEISYSDAHEISYDYSGNEIKEPSMDGNPRPFIYKIPPTEEPCLIIDEIYPYKASGKVFKSNLTPYKPSGWDDKIVVSNRKNTYTDTNIIVGETAYIDFAYTNLGLIVAQEYKTKLYADNQLINTYTRSTALQPNYYIHIDDIEYIFTTCGYHTIKLVCDAEDSASESNETDNEYSRTIYVDGCGDDSKPNLTPYKASGWDDKIVVSTVKDTRTNDEICVGQTVYIDYGYINNGSATAPGGFKNNVYVDNVLIKSLTRSNDLLAGKTGKGSDIEYTFTTTGAHIIKLVCDAEDSVSESNETDNEYTRTIYADDCGDSEPNLTPYKFTETHGYIYIYGTAYINNQYFEPGDILYVFTEEDMVYIGSTQITEEGEYFVKIFADNPNTEEKDGARPGDILNFKIFDMSKDEIIDLYSPNWDAVKYTESGKSYLNVDLSHEFEILPQRSINLGLAERWNYGVINSVENIKNQFAYCGTDLGLLNIDLREPQAPKDIAFLDIGKVCDIALTESEDHLLLAMGESGILIFNIDPLNPEMLSFLRSFDTLEYAKKIAISGNYGYIADPFKGMMVIDISDIKRPRYIGIYSNSDIVDNVEIEDICISDKYAYIAHGKKGLVIIDISNPAIPKYLSSFETSGYAYAVKIESNYAYVGYGGKGGLEIIDISNPNSPNYVSRLDLSWRIPKDIEIVNNCALIACSKEGIVVVDISDPKNPVYGGKFDTTGNSEDISIFGDYAYIADSEGGLIIFDISDPIGPLFAGKFNDNIIFTYDVTVDANYAYVIDEYKGLMILDVTDPTDPRYIEYSFNDNLSKLLKDFVEDHYYYNDYNIKSAKYYDVKISENFAYIISDNILLFNNIEQKGEYYSGILVVDISDKGMPNIIEIDLIFPAGMPLGLDIEDNYAYVIENYSGLIIFDITDPPDRIENKYDSPGGQNLFVDGSYAFLACGKKGIEIVDISNPFAPIFAGSFDTQDSAMNLYVSGQYAYIADGDDGLVILDVSDPTAPAYLGGYDTPHYCDDVVVGGNFAFIADHFCGLTIVDVSNPLNPKYAGGYDRLHVDEAGFLRNKARGIEVDNNYAYIANSEHGLVIINIEDPTGLQYLGRFDTSGYNKNIIMTGEYAYMANGYKGLSIIDISDSKGPKYIGGFDTYGFALDLAIKDDYVLLADDNSGLIAIDITHPSAPHITGNLDTRGPALSIAVKNNYAYVATGKYGLAIVDISNPSELEYLASLDTPGFCLDVELDSNSNHAYVADYQNGLVVIDISDSNNPKLSSKVYVPGGTRDVYLSGNYAFVIDGDGGLGIIDISDPNNPDYISRYELSEYPISLSVSGDYAYVVNNGSLTVIDISVPENPILAGKYDTAEYVESISVLGDKAYVAAGKNGLLEFKVDFNPFLKGNLVLIAGGGADSENSLWPVTKDLANYVFKTFLKNGYEVFDIWYQNPVHSQDIDGDSFYDKYIVDDSTPTKIELMEGITAWASKTPNNGPLYICIIGHGAEDRFQIMPNELVTAQELRYYIDKFQEATDYKRQVIIIIESAASGTFIDDLKGKGITVITSTDHGPSYIKPNYINPSNPFLDPNEPYFSFTTAFIDALSEHLNPNSYEDNSAETINGLIKESFIKAREQLHGWILQDYPFADQAPQMALPDNFVTSLSFFNPSLQEPIEHLFLKQRDPFALSILGKDKEELHTFNPHKIIFFSSDPDILDPNYIKTTIDPNTDIPWHRISPHKNGLVTITAYADPHYDPTLLLSAKLTIEVSDPNLSTDIDKMAIIVAGYRETGDYLWDSTNAITNHGYSTLRAMGYMKDEIFYYNPYLIQNLDTQEGYEITGYPHPFVFDPHTPGSPFSEIQGNIKELFIFLADHGNREEFYLNPKETLSLNSLLTHLTGIAEKVDEKIIILYDACHSGSFLQKIQEGQNLSLSEKIITITSTDPNQTAYFLNRGLVSFSYAFFDEWSLTHSLHNAFDFASYNLPLKGQTPCISNLNIIKEWDREKEYYVDESRPVIDKVNAYKTKKGELYLSARVFSLVGIRDVWVIAESAQKSRSAISGDAVTEGTSLFLSPDPEDPYFDTNQNVGYFKLITPDPCPNEANYILTIYASDRSKRAKVTSYKTALGSTTENKTLALILTSDPSCLPETEAEKIYTLAQRTKAILERRGLRESLNEIRQIKRLTDFQQVSLSGDQTLFVYLIGLVAPDTYGTLWFQLNNNESISPEDLRFSLPQDPNGRLLILMDTPYGEQFLSKVLEKCPEHWAGIASTNKDHFLFTIRQDGSSTQRLYPCFSNFFFSGVLSGATVAQAYRMADNAVSLTWQQPKLLPYNITNYYTMNRYLGYHLGISAIAGDDYSLFTDCKAHVEKKGKKFNYTLTLTPHPDAEKLAVWAVLTSSPSSLHKHNDIIDLEPSYDGNNILYYAQKDLGHNHYTASFMVEGRTRDKPDVTWTEWQKITIVHPVGAIGVDKYEPDDDPNLILSDPNHQLFVNHPPTIHTFFCPDPIGCEDKDWVYFYGIVGHVYEIYALDLSEYGYFINLTLIDPNGIVHSDDNYLSFECPKTGLCLLCARLASSYPAEGVEYLLSVYNPKAQDITDICGWVKDPHGIGLNGLRVKLTGPDDYYREDITRNGGYFHIIDVHAASENLPGYSLSVLRLNDPNPFINFPLPSVSEYTFYEIDPNLLILPDDIAAQLSYEQKVEIHRETIFTQIALGTAWFPPGGDHDPNLPPDKNFDGDGLTNQEEVISYGTSPLLPTVHMPLSTGMNPFYASYVTPLPVLIGKDTSGIEYYCQTAQKIWEKNNEPEIRPNQFNAIYTPEPGSLYLDLTKYSTIPVLCLKGFWDANHPEIRFSNSPSCIDKELFDPAGFCTNNSTREILEDPNNLHMIHTIFHKNLRKASWEHAYRFFGKPVGKDINITPFEILFVMKNKDEMIGNWNQ